MARDPWIVTDELWELVEPLLPEPERRFSASVYDVAQTPGPVEP